MCITSINSPSAKLRLMPTVVCLAMWKKNKIQYYQARASHQLGVALQISNSSTVQVTILNEPVLKPVTACNGQKLLGVRAVSLHVAHPSLNELTG